MKLGFRKRIATRFMLATALIILVVFGTLYVIVRETIYSNLDKDLLFESCKHLGEVELTPHSIRFVNEKEMEEIEHQEVQVNPVFIQVVDRNGKLLTNHRISRDNTSYFTGNNSGSGHSIPV